MRTYRLQIHVYPDFPGGLAFFFAVDQLLIEAQMLVSTVEANLREVIASPEEWAGTPRPSLLHNKPTVPTRHPQRDLPTRIPLVDNLRHTAPETGSTCCTA